MVSLAIISLIACSDNMGEENGHNDGFLHFIFSFNSSNENAWREADGTKKAPRFEAPIKVESDMEDFQPLYLHTVVEDHIDMPAAVEVPATRGQRYTGDAFYGDNSIQTFSIYGEFIDGDGFSQMEGFEDFLCLTKDLTTPENDQEYAWRTTSINFSPQAWGASQQANFYGCAPAGDVDPENPDPDCAKGVTTDTRNTLYDGVARPTLLYSMPAEEADHKDVLIAKTAAVGKNDDIRLEFHHILSAIRFKYVNTEGFQIKVKESATGDELTCNVRVKKLQLQGLYKGGKCNMSQDLTASNASTFWTVGTETGDCAMDFTDEIRASLETGFINDDAHCLMVLPQTAPTGAKVVLTCDLLSDVDGTVVKEDVNFGASLAGKQWLPGYSYTYSLSNNSESYEIYLTSTSAGVSEGPITIPVTGTAQSIRVASRMRKVSAGIESDWEPLNWHPEYSRDNGATWQTGVPEGYMLKDNRGMVVPDINNVLGNAEGEYTWQLEAKRPNFEFASTTALKNKPYTDHDLSLYDLDGTTPISRTTANCYVVNGYGTFKFPVAYGNAIKNGVTNKAAYTERDLMPIFFNYKEEHITSPYISTDTGSDAASALLLWQDEENMISPSSVGVTGSGENQYVVFTIKQDSVKAGNAVLAVKNSAGDIMWSWHIWVTNLNVASDKTAVGATTFSNYILGWRDPQYIGVSGDSFLFRVVQNSPLGEKKEHSVTKTSGDVAAGGTTLFYQYGRKDPFPGLRVSGTRDNKTQTRVYLELKNSGLYTYYPQYYVDNNEWVYDNNSSNYEAGSMPLAIKHPYHLFSTGSSNSDWMKPYGKPYGDTYTDYQFSGRWNPSKQMTNADVAKTVYDPCPYGYMVPSYNALNTDLKSVTPSAMEEGDPIPYRTVNGMKLYLPGYINRDMGVVLANQQLTISCSYTSTAPGMYYCSINTTGTALVTTSYGYRALSVLPMVDPDKTTVKPLTFSYTCETQLVATSGSNTNEGIRGFYKEVFDYYKSMGATKIYVTNIRSTFKPSKTKKVTGFRLRYRNSATQWSSYQTYSYLISEITNQNQRTENLAISPRLDITNLLNVEDWQGGKSFVEASQLENVSALKFYVTFEIE